MAMTGIGSTYGNVYESRYASSKREVTEKQEAEQAAGKKYTNASEYYAYLKDKYPCLTASNYKVTISPVYLEKCVKDPKKAELLEKNLEILPDCHKNLIVSWNALGADVKNEEWVFYEDGTAGMSPNMYVTNNHSSSGSRDQDEKIGQRAKKKSTLLNHYEKRKYLREQFEAKQARKAQIRGQLEESLKEKETAAKWRGKSARSRGYHAARAVKQYEDSILKA